MHRIPEIRSGMKNDLEGARERLILRLSSYAALHRARLTVVFDGAGHGGESRKSAGIHVLFSGSGESADCVIKRMVDSGIPNPGRTVVTSDREIQVFARHCGARVLSSREFADALSGESRTETASDKYDRSLSPAELDAWMKLFGQDPGG